MSDEKQEPIKTEWFYPPKNLSEFEHRVGDMYENEKGIHQWDGKEWVRLVPEQWKKEAGDRNIDLLRAKATIVSLRAELARERQGVEEDVGRIAQLPDQPHRKFLGVYEARIQLGIASSSLTELERKKAEAKVDAHIEALYFELRRYYSGLQHAEKSIVELAAALRERNRTTIEPAAAEASDEDS